MDSLTTDVSRLIVRELAGFQREIAAFPDDVTLWQTVPGVTNSAGNLAWHLAGNLQHFVGAVLGQTGYERSRDLEFSRRAGTRGDAIEELGRTIAVVERVLAALPAAYLDGVYPVELPGGLRLQTRIFLLQLAVHAAFHLGQAGYLRRAVTGDSTSMGPMSLAALA